MCVVKAVKFWQFVTAAIENKYRWITFIFIGVLYLYTYIPTQQCYNIVFAAFAANNNVHLNKVRDYII